MQKTTTKALSLLAMFAGSGILLAAGNPAAATDVYLRASQFDMTMHDGVVVPMWGFATCDVGWATCDSPTAPGPQLDMTAGDTLNIHVDNQLSLPVSIVVPGQAEGGDPVFFTDGLGRARVRSFTHETAAGGQSTYTWSNVREGTFLYQAGTYPSIEVPMGLFGALSVNPSSTTCTTGAAAYTTQYACYNAQTVMVFSEIDPTLNAAIAAANGDVASFPSTIHYEPSYFLVNGGAGGTLAAGTPGDIVLLRMLNAGLESHTPSIVGLTMGLLAEDGFPYPGAVRQQTSVLLAAGKTMDVLLQTSGDQTYTLFDRMAKSNYASMPGGGAIGSLQVGAGTPPTPTPTTYAVDDTYSVTEDTAFSGASVLGNDVGLAGATVTLAGAPAHGTLTLNADGTFSYVPNPNYSGRDTFIYSASDGTNTYPALATLEVSFENDAPVAAADAGYVNTVGADVVVSAADGVLGNDSDPDGDVLSAVLDTPPATGTLTLNADGSFTYTGGTPGTTASFTYHATDGVNDSDPVDVTMSVNAVAGIALTVADPDGVAVTDYRWTIQEDATFHNDPANPVPYIEQQFLNFHKSYMPVLAAGVGAEEFAQVALDPNKWYYVNVLPMDAGDGSGTGHSLGGVQLKPGTTAASVLVHKQPIPTARISISVFNDNAPINGAIDGGEVGMGGFQIILEEPGGRYGASGGPVNQDAFGNPLKNALDCFDGIPQPEGIILSCPDGSVLIDNLVPGKYGIIVNPPAGQSQWVDTSTIEGTQVVDAWVKAAEPGFMLEFGGPGPHVFKGFVDPGQQVVPDTFNPSEAVNTITGAVTLWHDPRPPAGLMTHETGNFNGLAHTRAWIGLNSNAGDGPAYAVVQAETDGTFSIPNIPDGLYQVVVWDQYLDIVIAFQTVTVAGGDVDMGHIPVNHWFTRMEHNVFLDENQDGIRQETEVGIPEQAVNLRWRDGTVYQSFPTDLEGFVPFDEVFPFFSWLVAEVDFARFKATGATMWVDGGGDTSSSPFPGVLSLQEGSPRTETGPVLVQGFQGFPGQTSVIDWGKAPYAEGENGGISGIVYYASTRAENDPRLAVGDTWEPGVPRVKVRLYKEVATDFDGSVSYTLVQEATTDSWDDNVPTGCPGENPADPFTVNTLGVENVEQCYDGFRNWNQIRPAVFDGGYAFTGIEPGKYVVEVVPPAGYEIVKEEDINVGFGDVFEMAPAALLLPGGAVAAILPDQAMVGTATGLEPGIAQPACVGPAHLVPDGLSLFPNAETYAPFAGAERPLCTHKEVHLSDQGQSVADFHLFTQAPVAAQYTGLTTDDIAIETNPVAPSYAGEKWSPAYLPISMRDYTGREVYRTYSDAQGRYNGLAPSTFTANVPMPSGYSPAMYSVCLNDPGDDGLEPMRNPAYGTLCYTMQFMPGVTTYLDTPVLPNAAFAADFSPPDCDYPAGTPTVSSISGSTVVATGGSITLTSPGTTLVANPAYQGPFAPAPYNVPAIERDLGFGTGGNITIGGVAMTVTSWTDTSITATVPAGVAAGDHQIEILRDNGMTAFTTLTVTVGNETPIVVSAGGSIQAAIDAASPGALILVEPGVYNEQVVLWKPVRLQGSGAGVTTINALKNPTDGLNAWNAKVEGLINGGLVDLIPGQALAPTAFGVGPLATEQGAGITVLAKSGDFNNYASRIDGFSIINADVGGGIFVNGYAHNLVISNNKITQNGGNYHGGIRVGHPDLVLTGDGPFAYNTNVNIHHNTITRNGAIGQEGKGGGISMCAGADGYKITQNFICGNYTSGDGAGIGHAGLSDGVLIEGNLIAFNQSLNPSFTQSGGGIYVGAQVIEPPFIGLGAGDVTIKGNLIQGNMAGSGHGGGIFADMVNGRDVELSNNKNNWYALNIINNIIVNNVAGWSGAGIALRDTLNANVHHNTIAHNDTTATVGALINLATGLSEPQPSGVVAMLHSAPMNAVAPGSAGDYSTPDLNHNIIWENRAFSVDMTGDAPVLVPELSPASQGDCPAGAVYWDVGVLGTTDVLTQKYSIFAGGTGNNAGSDPMLANSYCNGVRELGNTGPMHLNVAPAEGGNISELRYGPLTFGWPVGANAWDYHIAAGSPAIDYTPSGPSTGVTDDIDGDTRAGQPDVGADEYVAAAALAPTTDTTTTPVPSGTTQGRGNSGRR